MIVRGREQPKQGLVRPHPVSLGVVHLGAASYDTFIALCRLRVPDCTSGVEGSQHQFRSLVLVKGLCEAQGRLETFEAVGALASHPAASWYVLEHQYLLRFLAASLE